MAHTIDASAEDFWNEVFLSEEYNQRLYSEALGYDYKLESWDPEKGVRKARMWPSMEAPKAIKNLLGDSFSVLDDGVFDAQNKRYDFQVIASALSDRVSTSGTLIAQDRGEGKCERIVDIRVEAKILGLGRVIESFVESMTRRDYDRSAAFANEFLAEKNA